MNPVPVAFLGCCAARFLDGCSSLELTGNTSRGVFLCTECTECRQENKVIFLSCEAFHSPVTINLSGEAVAHLQRVRPGEPVQYDGNEIRFTRSGLRLHTGDAAVWQPPPVPQPCGTADDFTGRLHALSEMCVAQQPGGFAALLALRQGRITQHELPPEVTPAYEYSTAFIEGMHRGCHVEAAASLERLLGMGRGLTPSGDDFTEGLLLLLNRWRHVLQPLFDLAQFNDLVTAAARRRTTALSATLIECAAAGSADERVLAAADYLMSGQAQAEEIAQGLLSLGSSSGIDALCGMAAALDL